MGTGMGNTRTFEIPWVEAWVFKEFSGWVLGGCCAGAAWGCSAGELQFNKKTVYWITYKSTARTPKFPMGATWVYSGCTVGVAMATMFLADFAWVGGGWVQCSMKNRGWKVGG